MNPTAHLCKNVQNVHAFIAVHIPSTVGELENTVSLSPPPPSVGVRQAFSASLHGRSAKEGGRE